MRENHLLLTVERSISAVESFFCCQRATCENDLDETLGKRGLPNSKYRRSAQEIQTINPDDLEVASFQKKRARMEKSTTSSRSITRSARKFSDSSRCQKRSKTSAKSPPATSNFVGTNNRRSKESPGKHAAEPLSRN